MDILAPRSQYQGYISTRGRAIQCNSLHNSARSWHTYASPAPLFPKYPMCGHNRERTRGFVWSLTKAMFALPRTANWIQNTVGLLSSLQSVQNMSTRHRGVCNLCPRLGLLFVDGSWLHKRLRQDRFAQPTHPASPSAYSVFPTPNTFLRCRQPCIDLQTKAHNAQRCPPYAYKSLCLFT